MKFRRSKNSKPIPILLDEALRERIEKISEQMGEPKSTVMRIAMRIGLDGLVKAFEAAKQKSAASIVYPEHVASAPAMNEAANSSQNEAVPGMTVAPKPEKFPSPPKTPRQK